MRGVKSTRLSAVLVIISLVASTTAAQTICPTASTYCTAAFIGQQYVYDMECSNIGVVDQLPAACPLPQIVRKLDIKTSTILSLPARALDGLRVRILTLSQLSIATVDVAAFEWLSSDLEELALDGNRITTLPNGVFSKLSKLSRLQLQNNRLTTISADLLSGLVNIINVDFSNNLIVTVETDAWKQVRQLTILHLQNNALVGPLNLSVLAGLGKLENLRLDGNQIEEVAGGTFDELTSLRKVNIARNRIGSLPDNVFASNTLLEEVDASYNEIVGLSVDVFNETKRLTSLRLQNNRIDTLPTDAFRHMYNLRHIQFQNNLISDVQSNTLTGLSSARSLDLSGNLIKLLPTGIFDPLGLVESLSLAENRIAVVEERPFEAMRNLVSLNFSGNLLTTVGADWFTSTSRLVELRLDGNRLNDIDVAAFSSLSSLQDLYLDHNQLKTIQNGLFQNCSVLRHLDLSFNPLRQIADEGPTFSGLASLRSLNISSTCLTQLTLGNGTSLVDLEELDLSKNNIRNLTSSTFTGVRGLKRLHLAENDIDELDNATFSSLQRLELLDLSLNALESNVQLNDILSTLSASTVVDLSWNLMTDVDALPALPGGVLLHGNPLICECNSTSWLRANVTRLLDNTVTACLDRLTGKPEVLACYWSSLCTNGSDEVQTSSGGLGMSGGCVAPPDSLNYLVMPRRRPAVVCPWDIPPPSVRYVTATSMSTTSAYVSWNLTAGSDVIVTVYPISGSTNDSFVMEASANLTRAMMTNMTAGVSYNICVIISNSPPSCIQVTLPDEPTPSPPPSVMLQMTASATDTALHVDWAISSTAAGRAAVIAYRLTWSTNGTLDDVTTVWLDADNTSYVISGLSETTEYEVCVMAIGEGTRILRNESECETFTTRATPTDNTMLIIIIAASVAGVFLLLVIIIVVIVVCCRCCRKRSDDAEVRMRKPVKTVESTRSMNRGSLPQHSVVSVSVYDEM